MTMRYHVRLMPAKPLRAADLSRFPPAPTPTRRACFATVGAFAALLSLVSVAFLAPLAAPASAQSSTPPASSEPAPSTTTPPPSTSAGGGASAGAGASKGPAKSDDRAGPPGWVLIAILLVVVAVGVVLYFAMKGRP